MADIFPVNFAINESPLRQAFRKLTGHLKGLTNRKKRVQQYQPTVGEELVAVRQDHLVKTHPANNRNRRTLVLERDGGPTQDWGFTLQSYGLRQHGSDCVDDHTYVDYVEIGSPAFLAGLRKGDIILSVNGVGTDNKAHGELTATIKSCGDTMRLVVMFEDCSRKVDLQLRYIRLKNLLSAKEQELEALEGRLSALQRGGADGGLVASPLTPPSTPVVSPTPPHAGDYSSLPRSPPSLSPAYDVGGARQFSSLPIRNKKRPSSLSLAPPTPTQTDGLLSRISRSRSLRSSFRQSLSPGETDSSNYVVTEDNSREDSEPRLLSVRQGGRELRSDTGMCVIREDRAGSDSRLHVAKCDVVKRSYSSPEVKPRAPTICSNTDCISDSICLSPRFSSTGSDITSSSSDRDSDYNSDPFSPPEDKPFMFPQETPSEKPLKRLTRRILTYSRHKDELMNINEELMNINEEDEVTRL